MAVTYSNILSADLLVSEIAQLNEWRDDLLRRALYPAEQAPPALVLTSPLMAWCEAEKSRSGAESKAVARLALIFADLQRVAAEVQAAAGAVPVDLYDKLARQFSAYIEQLLRLHQDLVDVAGALDTLTGLRTVSGLRGELRREQDRFDRKGASFSIASLEVDGLDALRQAYSREDIDAIYSSVAKNISAAIRSFDDAYYVGQGEYLLILKHVEFMDACAAMDRLCGDIMRSPVHLPSGKKIDISVSVGVAEAQQKESPEGVVDYAKSARLIARQEGGGRVHQYQEKSALEHFARDIHKDR